jgi:hypothetical protein
VRGTVTATSSAWRSIRGSEASVGDRLVSIASLLVPPVSFAVLVLVLWLPFGPRNGMPYETAFPYTSETTSWFDGFFYVADPLRVYTSLTYQASYLIGEITGHTGSFVPYQLVYAALWWGRGVLVFLIVAALLGRRSVAAYLAGALTIVHASDHALNWVGQMNQFGMMFFLVLSLWLLLRGLLADHWAIAATYTLAAVLAIYMCLWSYESGLFIALVVPAIFLLVRPAFRMRGRLSLVAAFYLVPAYYIALSLHRYIGGESTYQNSVTREDISPIPLLSDLVFNIRTSLAFWHWDAGLPPADETTMRVLGVGGAVTMLLGLLGTCWPRPDDRRNSRRALMLLSIGGALILVASFPAYLILTSARLVWRTQFLSGIGFALFAAGVIAVVVTRIHDRRAQVLVAGAAAAAIAYFGAMSAYRAGHFHYGIWLRHKHAVDEVLEAAPRIAPNTLVVFTNIPRRADPFGDTMWFDLAVRLAYPDETVAGLYFYADGKPPPGATLTLRSGTWRPTERGYPPLIQNVPLSHTIFIRYGPSRGRILQQVPSFLAAQASPARYTPLRVVGDGAPDARALRRYGPLPREETARGA